MGLEYFSRNWPVDWRFYIDLGNQESPLEIYKKNEIGKLKFLQLSLNNIDGWQPYHKTLLDIINCKKSECRQKSVVLIVVKGLFFVTARKKVDGFVTMKEEAD